MSQQERKWLSCFRGMAPIDFPGEWLEHFDYDHGFACINDEALIRFPQSGEHGEDLAFGIRQNQHARCLSEHEVAAIHWGNFRAPWEPHKAAELFGHARKIKLDDLI